MSEEENKKEEKLEWETEKNSKISDFDKSLEPILKSLLLLIEEEKKMTMKKIEDARRLLEVVKRK